MKTIIATATMLAICGVVSAQGIERVKMTDNDLSCQQVYNEINQMDGVIARANQPQPAGTDPNAAAAANSGVGQQVAGAVAQQAIGQVAARSGFGGFGGFGGGGGGFGGGLGGAFGSMLGGAAQAAAQQQAQQAAAAQQVAAQQAQTNGALVQQAQARKEHLTGLFLGKGCKMSEIQK